MAFPTFMMGCLPSYERVGPLAIVLLILVRCLQGLSVGGQLMSSLVFTLEQNPRHQWGLFGSYVMAAANFGTLLGGLIASTLRATMTEEQLLSYGWRIPFLSGILVSLCGFYLKFYGDEDTIDHHHGGGDASTPAGNPIKMAFRKENLGSLIAASLVPMLWSGGFYISFVWMATFTGELMIPPVPGAFIINSAALFVSVCILFPLAGILSDIFGRVKVMFLGGAMLAIFHPVMLYVISQGNPAATFFAQSAIGIMLSLWGAPSK
jgi:MHS family proline/betaine transporter-like MFS transporter